MSTPCAVSPAQGAPLETAVPGGVSWAADAVRRRRSRSLRDPAGLLLVGDDPQVIAAAREASAHLHGHRPIHVVSGPEALSSLLGPGTPPRHLVLQGGAADGPLLAAARDRFAASGIVVVARPGDVVPEGLPTSPAEGVALARALATAERTDHLPEVDAAALAAGLERGEITVRFQPIVRMSDGRPVMVEALARWERPAAALGAAAFVALAEQAGLAARLTLAVARRALPEFAAVRPRPRLRLSFNVPLAVLLEPDLPAWLLPVAAGAGLSAEDLLLELTESTVVRDTALLRRALLRLRRSGFRVLLDDLGLDDPRRDLLELPFAGVKLDRSLVALLPRERRARALVERLVRDSRARGRAVIAEGVTDARIWRAAAGAGCDLAQGFGVGRPLPPSALPAWISAWRSGG